MCFLSEPVVACSARVNGHSLPVGVERRDRDVAKTTRLKHADECCRVRPEPVCRVVAFFGRWIESKRRSIDVKHGAVRFDDNKPARRRHITKLFQSEHWMTQMVEHPEEKYDIELA